MPNKKINQLSSRTPALTDLILVGDPATGYSYKATLSAMINFVGGNIQFSSLGGISLTNPTNGQYLTFNGTNWVNTTLNTSTWDTAYNRSLTAAAVSGTTTKTLTLTKQDGSTLTATWSDLNTDAVTSVFGRTGAVVAAEGDYSLTQLSDVTISTPTSGQVLKYNGTAWVNDSDTDTGITSLNGLTATTQTFATGTSGTDFAISSTTSTHTFNLPTASAINRGALSSSDWSTFNSKQNAITLTTTGDSGASTLVGATLNIPTYTLAGLGGITLNNLAASSPLIYDSITGVFSIQIANSTQSGYLSSLNWNTFNNKQNAITLTTTGNSGSATFVSDTLNIPTYTLAGLGGVSGSGTTNYLSKWTGTSALGNSQIFDNGTSVGIGTATPSASYLLDVNGTARVSGTAVFQTANNTSSIQDLVGTTTFSALYLDQTTPSGTNYAATSDGTTTAFNAITTLSLRIGNTSFYELTSGGVSRFNHTGTPPTFIQGYPSSSTYTALYQGKTTPSGTNYSIASDATQTLINAPSTGNIEFRINNSAVGRIDASGNVGIGTTSPSYLLDVNGTARVQNNSGVSLMIGTNTITSTATPAVLSLGRSFGSNTAGSAANIKLRLYGSSGTADGTEYGLGVSASLFELQSAEDFAFFTGQTTSRTERMRIKQNGSIGIGTTNPTNTLYINGSTTIVGVTAKSTSSASGSTQAGFYAENNSGHVGQLFKAGSAYTTYKTTAANDCGFYNMGLGNISILNDVTAGNIVFATGGSSTGQLRIFSNGNVGINQNTDAGFRLDINGTARIQNNSSTSLLIGSTTSTSTSAPAVISLGGTFSSQAAGTSANVKLRIYDDGNTSTINGFGLSASLLEIQANVDIGFFTGNSTSRTERMRIKQDGSIGVGTTSPNASALLDVSSTTKGILFPRMTTTQKNAITTPAAGLVVYDTTLGKLCVYTTAWETITSA